MRKLILLCTVAGLMAGCGPYKKYQRPEVETDGLFGEAFSTADTTTLADVQWQDLFTDPYLQELVRIGLENNTDLQSAFLRVKQAEASLAAARLSFLPSFFFAPEGAISSFDRAKASKTYTVPVAASWEIDVSGRLQNAKKRAKATYIQTQEYQQAVRTQLIAAIASHYYVLLMLDAQYEISASTAATWWESVETMRLAKNAGMTTEAGVAQTEANYYAIEASLHDIRQQINETQNNLALLLAEPPHELARGRLKDQVFPRELSAGIPLQLLANRPDVRSAELAVMAAHYAANEARSSLYPSLTLSGVAGWTNSAGSFIVNPGKLLLNAAASLTQPLFNKGMNRAQVKIAEAQRQEAILGFRQAVLNAGAEVNDALTQYQTAKNKKEIRINQIEALERALESTELLMAHGTTTYLEILTARQGLLSAQLTQITDHFNEIQAVITLYHALGGGRETAGETTGF